MSAVIALLLSGQLAAGLPPAKVDPGRDSLAGVKVVTVMLSIATNLPSTENAELEKQIQTETEVRLRAANVQVQDAEDHIRDLVATNGKAPDKVGLLFASISFVRNSTGAGGVFNIHLGLYQNVILATQPTMRVQAQTWEREGGLTRTKEDESAAAHLRLRISDLVAEFLNDLLAARSKTT